MDLVSMAETQEPLNVKNLQLQRCVGDSAFDGAKQYGEKGVRFLYKKQKCTHFLCVVPSFKVWKPHLN
jgi:hypothetical protein